MNNQRLITLLGKVDRRILKKMNKGIAEGQNNTWFFIDYTTQDIKVGESFDVLLEGNEKKLVSQKIKVKIKEVYDQFGMKMKLIPLGFQTLVNFEFSEGMPPKIDKLPTNSEWMYNVNPVSLAKHEDIQLAEPDFETTIIYKYLVSKILMEFKNENHLQRNTLINFLVSKGNVKTAADAKKIINRLKMFGFVEENQNEELELVPS